MSVEGMPTVDDIAEALIDATGDVVSSTGRYRAAEAVHALYAPVLADYVRAVAHADGLIADAARYREALEEISNNVCDHDSYTSCGCGNVAERIADDALGLEAVGHRYEYRDCYECGNWSPGLWPEPCGTCGYQGGPTNETKCQPCNGRGKRLLIQAGDYNPRKLRGLVECPDCEGSGGTER